VRVICTSWPVNAPLPPVFCKGEACIPPGCTLFNAVNVGLITDDENVRPPDVPSREAKATSLGELARVGTLGVRVVLESRGNIRYISTVIPEIEDEPPVPGTNKPMIVAELIVVGEPTKKSSAASISDCPGVPGRDAIAI